MAVSGVLGKWNLARLEVRYFPPPEIYDGLPTLLGVELVNRRRWLPLFLMEVVVADRTLFFPIVDCRRECRKSLDLTLSGRGRQGLPGAVARSRFPVNFFIRSQELPNARQVTVFPAPLPCPDPLQADPGGGQGVRQQWQRGFDGDIDRISDYQGGEPLKSIHWKLTARHDRLKVKELSATTSKPVILDVADLPGQGIEQKLRYASYLVVRWLRAGCPVGLRTGERELAPGAGLQHKLLLLETLALYDQD